MLKKIFVFLISIFVLCSCTSQDNSKEIVTFASWGSITEVKVLKKIISDFELKNPQIKISFMHIPQNYFQKIHLLFASNTAPDVVFINNLHLPIYANQLMELTNIINEEDFYVQTIKGLSYKNKLLAIPRDVSNLVLYVNKDLIKNLPAELDMENLLTLAQNATSKNTFGISFEPETYYMLPYLAYFGEDFGKSFLPEKSQGFKFYKELRDLYNVAPKQSQIGSSTLAQMFLDQKIAMFISGRWIYPKINEKANFDWEIVPFPLGKSPYPCDSSGWAISKNSRHKDASIKFVQYLSSVNSAKYFANTGLIVPARKDVALILNNSRHNEKAFLDVIINSKNTNVTPNYKKLVDKINLRILE